MVQELRAESPHGKQEENDHDRSDKSKARLRLQERRLPLQSVHLQELRLLRPEGRAGDGAAFIPCRTEPDPARSSAFHSATGPRYFLSMEGK